jgi:hypothetical protein
MSGIESLLVDAWRHGDPPARSVQSAGRQIVVLMDSGEPDILEFVPTARMTGSWVSQSGDALPPFHLATLTPFKHPINSFLTLK